MKRITKAENLRLKIFRDILHGKYSPGERLPTERDMTEISDASRIIVRQAYAELEEAGVLQRVQGSGTFVAKTASGNAANRDTIALLTSVRDTFSLEFLEAVEKAATAADAMLVLRLTEEDPEKEEAAAIGLVAHGVRNLIIWPSGRGFAEGTFERLRVLGVNMVFFDRVIPGDYADYIGLDNTHGVNAILKYALVAGATRFAFINHEGDHADTDMLRQKAFEQWCVKKDFTPETAVVPWRGNYAGAIAKRLKQWAVLGNKMALVCVNDDVACSVKAAVGNRMQVYGIDGLEKARQAGVISYHQPMTQMAGLAVEMIRSQQKLVGKWKPQQKFCRGRLITK